MLRFSNSERSVVRQYRWMLLHSLLASVIPFDRSSRGGEHKRLAGLRGPCLNKNALHKEDSPQLACWL